MMSTFILDLLKSSAIVCFSIIAGIMNKVGEHCNDTYVNFACFRVE